MTEEKTRSRRFAYGVDPKRPERYCLRQARYDAIDALAAAAARQGRRLTFSDIGAGRQIVVEKPAQAPPA